ncbi:hypothetical protein ASC93_11090 [Massilia sp. Root335]|nr:hypothetical protein ASC93_11090 [Massilia sp. Root335]
MNATQNAKLKLETAKRPLGLRLTVCGNTAGAKNRATLAKVLADTPATQTPRATNSKSTPSSTAANKARLAAILADD